MTQNQPYFSIIIPNYKTEPFLEQCIKSVLNQKYTDFECILLNDGSPGVEVPQTSQIKTETSSDYWLRHDYQNIFIPKANNLDKQAKWIFDKLVGKDRRFSFVDKENSGQGATRNIGIKIAKGKRLVLLDCDDFLDDNYLQNVYEQIHTKLDHQICYAGIKNYEEGRILPFLQTQKFVPKVNNLKSMLVFPTWTINPVNYFWNIEILKKYSIRFPEQKKLGEDSAFITDCILAYYNEFGSSVLNDFKYIQNAEYNYRNFPYQNYRVENFEINLFHDTTAKVKTQLEQYKKCGFIYYVLAKLFIIRFRLYRIKLISKYKILKILYGFCAKFLTIVSLLISGTRKL
jgi:glycosyltransferase involved in cell wall biosynthesis